jgi:uncharacterized protein involved in exopolysaccharide biosynthesis
MNANQAPGMPPFDPMEITWLALVKARWKILVAAGVGAGLGLVVGLAQPNVYTSLGKFRVDAGQLASVMESSRGGGSSSTAQGMRASREEVIDELEILSSQDIMMAVAQEVGTDALLRPADPSAFDNQWTSPPVRYMHQFQAWLLGQLNGMSGGDTWERESLAMLALQGRTFVGAVRGSNVITVSHSSAHPDVAQQVVKAYMDAGERQHVAVFSQDPQDLEVLRERSTSLRAHLHEHETAFQDHKLECGFQNLELNTGFLTGRITELQNELNRAEAELAELEASHGAAQEIVSNEQAYVPQSSRDWVDNPDWVTAHDLYVNLQTAVTEKEMAAVGPGARNPNDPAYVQELTDLVTRRDEARALRDTIDPKVMGPETRRQQPNPAFTNAQRIVAAFPGQKAAVEARLFSSRAQSEKAVKDLASAHACGSTHETFGRKIAGLKEEIVKNNDEYAAAGRRADSELLGKTNLRRISEAFLPIEKDGPRRSKSILIGLFLFLFGASALAVLREVIDRRLRRPVEVERLLGLRVLAALPECRSWARRGRVERGVVPADDLPDVSPGAQAEKPKAEVSA